MTPPAGITRPAACSINTKPPAVYRDFSRAADLIKPQMPAKGNGLLVRDRRASPPPVRDFPAMEAQIRDEVARLGVIDMARNILAEP